MEFLDRLTCPSCVSAVMVSSLMLEADHEARDADEGGVEESNVREAEDEDEYEDEGEEELDEEGEEIRK